MAKFELVFLTINSMDPSFQKWLLENIIERLWAGRYTDITIQKENMIRELRDRIEQPLYKEHQVFLIRKFYNAMQNNSIDDMSKDRKQRIERFKPFYILLEQVQDSQDCVWGSIFGGVEIKSPNYKIKIRPLFFENDEAADPRIKCSHLLMPVVQKVIELKRVLEQQQRRIRQLLIWYNEFLADQPTPNIMSCGYCSHVDIIYGGLTGYSLFTCWQCGKIACKKM